MKSLLAIFAIVVGTAQGQNETAERMPLAHRSLLLDVVASGEQIVAVGERGHVLFSQDNRSWQQADYVPTRANLTAIASVGDRLWAVGHDAVIIASADGGKNWTLQWRAADLNRPLLDVFFLDAQVGIAVGAYGYFLHTTDGGITWDDSASINARLVDDDDGTHIDTNDVADDIADDQEFSEFEDEFVDYHLNGIARLDDGTLFIAAEAGQGYTSFDDGQSWHALSLPYDGSMFGVLATGDTLLAYGLRGHLFESSDAGRTWEARTSGVLATMLGGALAADGTVFLVGTNGVVLYRRPGQPVFTAATHPSGDDLAAAIALSAHTYILVGEQGIYTYVLPEGA